MPRDNRFTIRNESPRSLTLNVEPEGVFVSLAPGDGVVTDSCLEIPVAVIWTQTPDGEPAVSIWPGDGEVRVTKDGVDVLDAAAAVQSPA